MNIALYELDIPQNTGTILRMCACLGVAVDIIEPAGFSLSDKALKRAGLDYLEHAEMRRHMTYRIFEDWRMNSGRRLVLCSAHAAAAYTKIAYSPTDILLMGRETSGVPASVVAAADVAVHIPMRPGLRSLNVAVAAGIILGEALRQTDGFAGR
ncbi:MAG: TrmH family RNA methyltransferase [Hyphomicrobiaceae bacterium]|nr:TrmH family RNA methyltransferase [Hyphomicrobiaceae bacterium]